MAERCGAGDVADLRPAADRCRSRSGEFAGWPASDLARRLPVVRRGAHRLSRLRRPASLARLLRPAGGHCQSRWSTALAVVMLSVVLPAQHELDPRPARHHRRATSVSRSVAGRSARPATHVTLTPAWIWSILGALMLINTALIFAVDRTWSGALTLWPHHGRRSCCLRPPARFSCRAKPRRAMSWRR